ncbi:MAG: hypothetical protein IIB94_07315 [Candidatus Marinimicrobia bacterium]|nr:hypothetical protein [Candidatus Neomarinimicrobiota bacterium]
MNILINFFKRFSDNLSIKISSLIIALTLWLFVVTGSEYVHVVKIPIRLRNLQQGRILANEIPEFAELRMRGTGRQFLNNQLTTAFADMGIMLEMGRIRFYYEFALEPYLKNYPDRLVMPRDFGLELVEIISPDTVKIKLDSYLEKVVPVRPRVTISTDPGYIQVGKTKTIPSEVTISGPSSLISEISESFTAEINFEARKNSVKETMDLNVSNKSLIKLEPAEVELTANIQSIGERTLEGIEVQVRNVPENLKAIVNPTTVSLDLQGGIAFLSGLTGGDIDATIDYATDWLENKRMYSLKIVVPEDVINWSGPNPSEVEVIVIRERISSASTGN